MTKKEIIEIIESIKNIDDGVYPEEKLEILIDNKELSEKYMIDTLKNIVKNPEENLNDGYFLAIYALAFLGEIQSKKSFEVIVSLLKLESVIVESYLGDGIYEILPRVLYHTFNGEEKILLQMIYNTQMNIGVRTAALKALISHYVHDADDLDEAKLLLEELMLCPEIYNNSQIVGAVINAIIDYSFVDQLSLVEDAYRKGLVDIFMHGEYDSFVDSVFEYNENYYNKNIKLSTEFKHWACFKDEKSKTNTNLDFSDLLENAYKKSKSKTFLKQKNIGRNDPCYCGSGKKYKKCCINKYSSEEFFIMEEMERWLKYYPKVDGERKNGQVLLSDLFDDKAIEIDKYLYLALHHRAIPVWEKRDYAEEERRKSIYLNKAKKMIDEKMEKENLENYSEYDKKHKIHYNVSEIY
jgi:hypothetical protein